MSISLTIRWDDSDWRRPKTENQAEIEEERTRAKKYFVRPSVLPDLINTAMVRVQATKMTKPWMPWRTFLIFWRFSVGSCIAVRGRKSSRDEDSPGRWKLFCHVEVEKVIDTRNWGSSKIEAMKQRVGRT